MIAPHSISPTATTSPPRRILRAGALALASAWLTPTIALDAGGQLSNTLASVQPATAPNIEPLLALGIGDAVSVQVYGRPELDLTTYVSDDGTIPVPLAGDVQVSGLSPATAGQRIATAFRNGEYLVNPQVTVLLVQARSQLVSVLGAVRTPGRFAIDSKATVLDVLAQAGGTDEDGGDVIVLLRPDKNGKIMRHAIDLKGLSRGDAQALAPTLRSGDSIFVPPAERFSIYGEVRSPNMYRLESGMTVVQAIALGGGITPRGSSKRIEIKRRKADGTTITQDGKLGDTIRAGDVIRIKERIF